MRRRLKSTQGGPLERAFLALGPGPTWRELELVADALRESGDDDAIAMLEGGDKRALDELALASGSNGFVALDLLTEFVNPGEYERMLARGREDESA